jgi:WXG100 family type VII secretion target
MTNTVVIGSEEFKTDLAQFTSTIATVSSSRDAVEADLRQLESVLSNLTESWQSPAGATYAELQSALMGAAKKMSSVLDEMVSRMKITYETYLNAEQANTKNLNLLPSAPEAHSGGKDGIPQGLVGLSGGKDGVPQAPTVRS